MLQHFEIRDGRIRSYNGVMMLSAPIDLPVIATPRADQFTKAIAGCGDAPIALSMTGTGRIGVRAGKFRAYVDCVDTPFPVEDRLGFLRQAPLSVLATLKLLAPFMAIDASRPWAMGVLFDGPQAYATNNVVLVNTAMTPLTCERKICLPREAVLEMLRINEEPVAYYLEDNAITFGYEGGRVLHTRLQSSEWPNVQGVIKAAFDLSGRDLAPIPEDMVQAMAAIKPFVGDDNRIHYGGNMLCTSLNPNEGAGYEIGDCNGQNFFNHAMLELVVSRAKQAAFGAESARCPFVGDGFVGVIVGCR